MITRGFWLLRCPVTQELWQRVVQGLIDLFVNARRNTAVERETLARRRRIDARRATR